jgi:ribosomal protein L15
MAAIKKFNWLPKPSAWKEVQAWRFRRAELTAVSLDASDTFNAKVAKANKDRLEGLAKLAGEAAVKRIKLEAKAKFDKIANTKVDALDNIKVDKTV